MEFEFLIDGALRRISLEKQEGGVRFAEGESVVEADVRQVSGNELRFSHGGRTFRVHLARDGSRAFVSVDGREFTVAEAPPETGWRRDGDERTPEGSLRVKAPMPGKVIKLGVREGDKVRKNQTLVIVEAMKMENEIQAPAEGTVKKVHVAVGELVDSERPLIEIESKET
jgi:biotin carboxyl carrier protein